MMKKISGTAMTLTPLIFSSLVWVKDITVQLRWFWLGILTMWVAPVLAIVIRHDRADTAYQAVESDFPQIFYLHIRYDNKVCMANLIDAHWALTAAHCTEQTPLGATIAAHENFKVSIAGIDNTVSALVIHPDYQTGKLLVGTDLALLYLDSAVEHVSPLQLNNQDDEQSAIMELLGWGFSGLGTMGRQGNDGRFRHAQNQVEDAAQWLRFRFDDPREPNTLALELEGVPGLGDSGGPALWSQGGNWLLSGVAVGELEPVNPGDAQGRYGAIEIYERISLHYLWITSVMTAGVHGVIP